MVRGAVSRVDQLLAAQSNLQGCDRRIDHPDKVCNVCPQPDWLRWFGTSHLDGKLWARKQSCRHSPLFLILYPQLCRAARRMATEKRAKTFPPFCSITESCLVRLLSHLSVVVLRWLTRPSNHNSIGWGGVLSQQVVCWVFNSQHNPIRS